MSTHYCIEARFSSHSPLWKRWIRAESIRRPRRKVKAMVTRASIELRGRQARSEVGAVTVDVPAGLRWLAALLSIGAAGLHFAVGPAHFDEYLAFGWFFVVAAWLQALWAIAVVSAPSRLVMTVGLFGNLLVLGLWMWTRLVAVPLGPDAGHPESFALVDGLAAGFEAVVVVLAAWLWRSARPAGRGGLSRYLAVALVSLPIMALLGASLASAGGAHGDGEEHEGHQVTSAIAATDAGDPGPATGAPTTTAPATADEAAAMRRALTQGTSVASGGAYVNVDVLRATPEYILRTMPPVAYENWQPASGSVFIVAEAIHEGGVLPPEPLRIRLLDGDQFFEPERVESSLLHPHHRVTVVRFAQPFSGAAVTLVVGDGEDRLSWPPVQDASLNGSAASGAVSGSAAPTLTGGPDEGAAPASPDQSEALPVVVVEATAAGYSPDTIELTSGQPVIIQFVNRTNEERHFHIIDLAPQDLYWLAPDGVTTTAEGDLVPVKMPGRVPDAEALRAAQRLEKHVCDSQYGICLLGENVHMHANPGEADALLFTPNDRGTFEIIDLLNEQYHGTVIVR